MSCHRFTALKNRTIIKEPHSIISCRLMIRFADHHFILATINKNMTTIANWGDGSIQDINIPIIISGNDTRSSSQHGIRLQEWVMRNIYPDRSPYYISWRTDFKIKLFGCTIYSIYIQILGMVHQNTSSCCTTDCS
jgi:hypothetical protein